MKFRQLLFMAIIVLFPSAPGIGFAKVGGDIDKLQPAPTAYTIVCVPEQTDLQTFSTNPEFVSLRKMTDFTVYYPSNPDFKHRWADRLPEAVAGQITLIVEEDGKKLCGIAGNTLAEVASAVKSNGVIRQLTSSDSHHPFCPNCPSHPKEEPKDEEPREPLIAKLPPLIEKETTKVVEKDAESNPLAMLGLIAAVAAPLSICACLGSYFLTRNIDEQDSLDG